LLSALLAAALILSVGTLAYIHKDKLFNKKPIGKIVSRSDSKVNRLSEIASRICRKRE